MNLVTDPVFRVVTSSGDKRVSLPGLMELLGRDAVLGYVGLRRHQADPFHVFLSYLGGAVLARSENEDPVQDEEFWRKGLRTLAAGAGDEAWTLVVDDLAKPAFMQAPVKGESPEGESIAFPDKIDVLDTAKNHDVKAFRMGEPDVDEWVYALVSLQTTDWNAGRNHYPISRMNGGKGTRLFVEVTRTLSPGRRWSDAVRRLLIHRSRNLDRFQLDYGYNPRGLVLVWTVPWARGDGPIPLARLDPFYIEICRRMRLHREEGHLAAWDLLSNGSRIGSKELSGVVGDPWIPVELTDKKPKSLTPGRNGLTPDLLRRMLFADGLELSVLQQPSDDWHGDVWLQASMVLHAENKSAGFWERRILVPGPVRRKFLRALKRTTTPDGEDASEPLADLSKKGVDLAGEIQRAVERACVVFMNGQDDGENKPSKGQRQWIRTVTGDFARLWEPEYFEWLWGCAASESIDDDALLAGWVRTLERVATQVLEDAERTLPARGASRYRAVALAGRALRTAAVRMKPASDGAA